MLFIELILLLHFLLALYLESEEAVQNVKPLVFETDYKDLR